jgi:Flp pilus assembly protein TadD
MSLPPGWEEPPPAGAEIYVARKTFDDRTEVTLTIVAPRAERYQVRSHVTSSTSARANASYGDFLELSAAQRTLERLAADEEDARAPRDLSKMTELERVRQLIKEGWRTSPYSSAKHEQALAILEAAVAAAPTSTVLLTCLGAMLSDLGCFERAIDPLQRAVALGSVDSNTFYNLAVAALNSARMHGVDPRATFAKAATLTASPDTWQAYFDGHGH